MSAASARSETQHRMLLIDTCGDPASIALSEGSSILAVRPLADRMASVELIAAIRVLLQENAGTLSGLHAIGIVSGPGSFTGVRIGMAAAKGLCEALATPLVTVSRLAVLAAASGLANAVAALDAGRGEVYVRDASGNEFLAANGSLTQHLASAQLVVAEGKLAAQFAAQNPALCSPSLSAALPILLKKLAAGLPSEIFADANYVRGESAIYPAKPPHSALAK